MTSLNETLTQIAEQIKADATTLMSYAQEDAIGGYHFNAALQLWPAGSVWGVEGQIIYALIRHLKPAVVAEIGGWAGCSAAHMAAAVKMNGVGHVYGVDDGSETTFEPYNRFPADLKPYITFVRADGRVWLAEQANGSIGLLFDDASHAESLIIELSHLAMQKCEPGGLFLNHDAMHDAAFYPDGSRTPSTLGRQVRDALDKAGLYFRPYLTEPSDCGLALTVVPGVKVDKSKIAKDHLAALSQPPEGAVIQMPDGRMVVSKGEQAVSHSYTVGNANIESEGLLSPHEPSAPLSQSVTKPRGKGKRK